MPGGLPRAVDLLFCRLPEKAAAWFKHHGIRIKCVQTDNGSEFTNRFTTTRDKPTLFEQTAAQLNIRHKLIRPYTPRHNGKVERSHREGQRRFYETHSFYSLDDFKKQLSAYLYRSNSRPMRPLSWLSPLEKLSACSV
ncbi:MAG: transposase family protein [Oscillospiraceae bacterium]|nr:transposase family protein [Oscillospiraceae bacterium]